MLRPIQGISSSLANLAKARVSLGRIQEILIQDEVIKNAPNAIKLSAFEDTIAFNGVSFSYTSDLVLEDISFEIKKGQTIAVVGESGSGKSTLLDLIPRFHDPSAGNITIDGIDLRAIDIQHLRQMIGIVAQDSLLFNATILENIAFGDEAPDMNRAIAAAKNANALEFITMLYGGFEYNVGDRGNKLSGGQKQRISIARAMYKNPEILLLDEATSALDTESERQVQLALDSIMKGKTSIVVAHRLSTIINADVIMVFKKGRIVETGSHQQLLQKQGEYAKFCLLQGIGLEKEQKKA
jgi:subfamily B ATP-binding cassette protein MsbA